MQAFEHMAGSFGKPRVKSDNKHKDKIEIKLTQDIQFSQASVAATFTDGTLVKDLSTKLLSGKVDISTIPAIRIVQHQQRWYTLDNRRLRAFKDAFIEKIPVIIHSLADPEIKKEFVIKKTNKSITEGGAIRITAGSGSQHFDGGTYVFTKQVLNWTFEQIATPSHRILCVAQALPAQFHSSRNYYQGFLDLIIEEARASLHAGIEASQKTNNEVFELSLQNIKKSKQAQNPSVIVFSKRVEDKLLVKPNDAYLLKYSLNNTSKPLQLLALASYAPNEDFNRVSFKVVLDEAVITDSPQAFEKHSKWKAKAIGSLVTHLRMYDVCTAAPSVSWLSEILTGSLKNKSKSAAALALMPQPQYPQSLNDSQRAAIKMFLELEQGIQLVQGPPGTGKTTMVSALLKLLIPQGRTLVCAPSNKAIHVLADKFLKHNPDVPMMLTGVEDKLPKDHDRLQDIFVHT